MVFTLVEVLSSQLASCEEKIEWDQTWEVTKYKILCRRLKVEFQYFFFFLTAFYFRFLHLCTNSGTYYCIVAFVFKRYKSSSHLTFPLL